MTMKSTVSLALAATLGASLMAAPAFADKLQKPRFGSNPDKVQDYTHEQVRKKQVRQTQRSGGPFQAMFHPLTSAWNQYTR